MLQIRLLGQFDIVGDGKRIVIPSRPGQSLLAYLVLNAGTVQRREKLAGLLWPDSSDEIARRNFRQQLWVVRKALAAPESTLVDYFRVDEISVAFEPNPNFWLDVAQLERPYKDDDALEELIQRAALYRGELLPGFYEDWVLLERERVSAVYEALMQTLLERLAKAERWNGVLEWGEKWLSFGTAPEPAFRGLMLAHAAQGDMAKVQAVYQRCVAALRDELGIEPSVETRALYEGLLKGAQIPARAPSAKPAATVTFLFTDIQGSTRLLEKLHAEYATVLQEHHEILRGVVKKWGGREMDTQGDAFFVTFGRAADAVGCAVQAQRELNAHHWTQGEQVLVRMGVHTGEPLLAGTGYIGMDVHRAARIGDAGHGGQVLLSETTRDLVIHDLPPGVTLRDLGEQRLKDLKYPTEIYQLEIEGLQNDFPPLKTTFSDTEPPLPGEAPFKGLEYFDVQDAELFFGREALTEQLARRIEKGGNGNGADAQNGDAQGNLLAVIGASGSGKSSLARGLIPAMRKERADWRLEIITPTAHPLQALAFVLTRDSESVTAAATLMDDMSQDPRALKLFLGRRTANDGQPTTAGSRGAGLGGRVLLVVDQFEELFTLCRDEFERQAFIDNLLIASAAASPALLTLIITLRADFYAHLAQYPELRDAMVKRQEYIGPMTDEELRRAMGEPARRAHWDFEAGLVDLILRDAGDEPGALPLLSHALLETWKRRSGHTLTLKGYHEAGGVRGAIAQTADSTYQQLSPEERDIARNIFLRLTELGEGTEDTRRRATIEELIPRPEDAEKVREVLNRLAAARLVTLGQDTAEVAHEALIREWGTLREWLNQGREGLRLHRHLTEAAQEWEMLERDPGALYRGARLAQGREWAALNANALNAQERAFLDASSEQEEREADERAAQQERELEQARKLAVEQQARAEEQSRANKSLRERALLLVGALALAILLAAIALFFGNQANQNANVAAVNAQEADKARDGAQVQERIANARELAANSLNNLPIDPQLSILLALQAIQATKADGTILPEAQDALHRAVIASHVEVVLPQQDLSQPPAPRGGHDNSRIAYSPDGSRIATRSSGVFKIWDSKTYQELLNLPVSPDFGSIALAYSLDGSQVVTLDHDASPNDTLVKFFDVHSGELVREVRLAEPWDNVFAAGFSPNFDRAVLVPMQGDFAVWDLTTRQVQVKLHSDTVSTIPTVHFSHDGKSILSTVVTNAGTQILDAASGTQVRFLCCHGDNVRSASYSPDGKLIVTGGTDAKIKIWDTETGKQLNTLSGHTAPIRDMAWSPDGKRLASASDDRRVIVWDVETGKEVYELLGHADWVEDVEFSPDGKQLVSSSEDKTVRVWDVGPSRELAAVDGPPKMYSYQHSADRMHLYASWSQNGEYDSTHGNFRIWDVKTLEPILTLTGGADFPFGGLMDISPDEKLGAFDDPVLPTVWVWDLHTNNEVATLAPGHFFVWGPKFSPDGALIAVPQDPDAAPEVSIWDVKTAQLLKTINLGDYGTSYLYSVGWSPDSRQVVTGWANGTTQVWDVNTGKQVADLPGHISYIMAIVYSPDGKLLATASRDGTTIVYDATTYKELYRLIGHTSDVLGLDFSPDGKYIATASQDGTAKVWDATDGKELASLYHSPEAVSSVMFTADSRHIITTSEDGVIREYTLDVQELIGLAKARLLRTWRQDECQKYLHVAQCPP